MIFSTTKEQDKEILLWKKNHDCPMRTDDHGIKDEIYVGAIGGAITYEFTPTGLGECFIVKCLCGQKFDLTDVSEW